MLAAIERRLATLLASSLESRTHIAVGVAPVPLGGPAAGSAVLRVSLGELTPDKSFEREVTGAIGGVQPPRLRRTVGLGFLARVAATLCPVGDSAAEVGNARTLLLEDVSLAAHALDAVELQNGRGFASAGSEDPGFEVRAFQFEGASLGPELVEGCLTAELTYRGRARVWPVGADEAGGEILGVDATLTALPARIEVDEPTLPPAAEATLKVTLGAATRRLDPAGTTGPMQVAATVLSDVAPAERGSISSGQPAAEGSFQLHPLTDGAAAITFRAPADGVSSPRVEYVAVHLARPDGTAGVFLGSAPIRLVPAP